MTNDLFGALDITEIPEFPENGTHEYVLKAIKTIKTKDDKNKLVMEFHLRDETSPFDDDKFAKWFNLTWLDEGVTSVSEFTPSMIKDFQKLKQWLIALSVPEDEIGTVDFQELTGTVVHGYGFRRNKWNGEGEEYFLMRISPI